MKNRFIVTIIDDIEGFFNIYDTKLDRFANDCDIEYVKRVYQEGPIDIVLYWDTREHVFETYKEIHLPLEAYLLLT